MSAKLRTWSENHFSLQTLILALNYPNSFKSAHFADAFTCIICKLGPDYFSAPPI